MDLSVSLVLPAGAARLREVAADARVMGRAGPPGAGGPAYGPALGDAVLDEAPRGAAALGDPRRALRRVVHPGAGPLLGGGVGEHRVLLLLLGAAHALLPPRLGRGLAGRVVGRGLLHLALHCGLGLLHAGVRRRAHVRRRLLRRLHRAPPGLHLVLGLFFSALALASLFGMFG